MDSKEIPVGKDLASGLCHFTNETMNSLKIQRLCVVTSLKFCDTGRLQSNCVILPIKNKLQLNWEFQENI